MSSPVEDWRPVVGYEGFYEVSSAGRVRSVARRRGARVGHVLRQHPLSNGLYLKVELHRDGVRQTCPTHRLVGEAFLGPLPDGLETRHLNGNGLDNNLSNLKYGTRVENQQDSIAHGTHISLRTKARTHCANGHEYTPQNTRLTNGVRVCRRCTVAVNIASQKRQLARREAAGVVTPHLIREWAQQVGIRVEGEGRLQDDVKWAYALTHPESGWEPAPDPRRQVVVRPTARDLIDRHPEWLNATECRQLRAA